MILLSVFVRIDDGFDCYSMEVCCYLCACQAYSNRAEMLIPTVLSAIA